MLGEECCGVLAATGQEWRVDTGKPSVARGCQTPEVAAGDELSRSLMRWPRSKSRPLEHAIRVDFWTAFMMKRVGGRKISPSRASRIGPVPGLGHLAPTDVAPFLFSSGLASTPAVGLRSLERTFTSSTALRWVIQKAYLHGVKPASGCRHPPHRLDSPLWSTFCTASSTGTSPSVPCTRSSARPRAFSRCSGERRKSARRVAATSSLCMAPAKEVSNCAYEDAMAVRGRQSDAPSRRPCASRRARRGPWPTRRGGGPGEGPSTGTTCALQGSGPRRAWHCGGVEASCQTRGPSRGQAA